MSDREAPNKQDGEDPNRRSDFLAERKKPGLHGGAGAPGWKPDKHESEAAKKTPAPPSAKS